MCWNLGNTSLQERSPYTHRLGANYHEANILVCWSPSGHKGSNTTLWLNSNIQDEDVRNFRALLKSFERKLIKPKESCHILSGNRPPHSYRLGELVCSQKYSMLQPSGCRNAYLLSAGSFKQCWFNTLKCSRSWSLEFSRYGEEFGKI